MIEEFGTTPELLAVGQFLFLIGLGNALSAPIHPLTLKQKNSANALQLLEVSSGLRWANYSADVRWPSGASRSLRFYPKLTVTRG